MKIKQLEQWSKDEKDKEDVHTTMPVYQKSTPIPDQWIDDYISGRKRPNPGTSGKSAERAVRWDFTPMVQLDQPVQIYRSWQQQFSWRQISHFGTKSRRTNSKYRLWSEWGRGEAYKQALLCLKQTCGRLDVMRATILNTIDCMNPGKDAVSLKRFADQLRTYLFDLSRIGKTENSDLTDKIITK